MSKTNGTVDREAVVNALADFRRAWEASIREESLVDVEASLGLVLGDLALAFGLTRDEQVRALGESLRRDYFQKCREKVFPA